MERNKSTNCIIGYQNSVMYFVYIKKTRLKVFWNLFLICIRLYIFHLLDFFFFGSSLDLISGKSLFELFQFFYLKLVLRLFPGLMINVLVNIFLSESGRLNVGLIDISSHISWILTWIRLSVVILIVITFHLLIFIILKLF